MSQVISIASRVLFVAAVLVAGLAVWEKLANLFNMTMMRDAYTPGRLLELAAIALLFVIAVQLRELKETTKG